MINKKIIFEAVALIILIVSALIIWVNTILRQDERTFKQEPLTNAQIDAKMMEWNGYENECTEIGVIVSQDIFVDNMEKSAYTKKGRLITND